MGHAKDLARVRPSRGDRLVVTVVPRQVTADELTARRIAGLDKQLVPRMVRLDLRSPVVVGHGQGLARPAKTLVRKRIVRPQAKQDAVVTHLRQLIDQYAVVLGVPVRCVVGKIVVCAKRSEFQVRLARDGLRGQLHGRAVGQDVAVQFVSHTPSLDQIVNPPHHRDRRSAIDRERVFIDRPQCVALVGKALGNRRRLATERDGVTHDLSRLDDNARLDAEQCLSVLGQFPGGVAHQLGRFGAGNDLVEFHEDTCLLNPYGFCGSLFDATEHLRFGAG